MSNNKNQKAKPGKDSLEAEIDQLESMWDKILEKGDDDYCDTVRDQSQTNKEDKEVRPRTRRRGRRV